MPFVDIARVFPGNRTGFKWLPGFVCILFVVNCSSGILNAGPFEFKQLVGQYCLDCHSGAEAESNLDLQVVVDKPIEEAYSDWRRILSSLKGGAMPPSDYEQPDASHLKAAIRSIEQSISVATEKASTDPGPATLRRLTNAEYEYCIQDLTGLQLDLSKLLVGDSVGSSGYTNSASGQFMQSETLERYLEAAKTVAEHVMVGAGPLYFNAEPGLTGLELSAIRRIQAICRQHGFRAAAGEGAKPFGLEMFSKSFQVAWQYRHRELLGLPETSIDDLAEKAGISGKFANHIWRVLNRPNALYPLSEIQRSWDQFPSPDEIAGEQHKQNKAIQTCADNLFLEIADWQTKFAASASHEEEAALLVEGRVSVPSEVTFLARGTRKLLKLDGTFTPDLSKREIYSPDGWVKWSISVDAADASVLSDASVVFSQPMLRLDLFDGQDLDPVPLVECLSEKSLQELGLSKANNGRFVVPVGESKLIRFQLPEDCRYAELIVKARLDKSRNLNTIARCTIRDISNDDAESENRLAREYSSLLGDPAYTTMAKWQAGLQEFASVLPQISHREPAPSDRDPIPELFDNTYNLPERNYFHTAIKYARDDNFLVNRILSSKQIHKLELAWTDLLSSFDYHDVNLRFAAKKFGIDAAELSFASLDDVLSRFPANVARELRRLKAERNRMDQQLRSARSQHLDDLNDFAERLWRRKLSADDLSEISQFYRSAEAAGLSHPEAVKATLARILVSPQFLYRIETGQLPKVESQQLPKRDLAAAELASRLSLALWSSLPDDELTRLADSGELKQPDTLESQVRRMLADPKSQRFAEQFFGQWLGFYQFDQFRGVDAGRFPEFDEQLRKSLYNEAIHFFAHLVQQDQDYSEMLSANYTFIDETAAKHYGIALPASESEQERNASIRRTTGFQKMPVANHGRGGMLGMAALLTTTSAPLRTSPVKRGDWILRRILGTPVPPPPADAGSLPADDVLADGLTVMERLKAHRSNAECMTCHIRIDPLGFALEHYDSLGRWRDRYGDGREIIASGFLADNTSISGIGGLREYLLAQEAERRRNFSANLVAYILGRSETLSDTQLIDQVAMSLAEDPRVSSAVLTIVNSVQFRQIRAPQTAEVVHNVR